VFIANIKMQTHMLYEFYLKHIYINHSQLYKKYVNRNVQQISYKEMVYIIELISNSDGNDKT
jgi:hypothetical protein